MYLEDEELENMYGELRNDGVAPPPEAKDFVMNEIGRKSYWKFVWIFLLLVGTGTTAYLMFPSSASKNGQENVVMYDQTKANNDTTNDSYNNNQNEVVSKSGESVQGSKLEEMELSANQNQKADKMKKGNDPLSNLKKEESSAVVVKKSSPKSNFKKEDKKEFNPGKKEKALLVIDKKDEKLVEPKTGNLEIQKHKSTDIALNEEVGQIEELDLEKLQNIDPSEIEMNEDKNIQIDLRETTKMKKIRFAIEARMGYAFSDVYKAKNEITYDNIGMLKNIQSFEAGVNGILNFKSFLVKTGIGYQKDFTTTNYSEDILQYRSTVVYEELLDSSGNAYNAPLYTFVDTSTFTNTYKMLVSTSYFTLPVQLGYQFRLNSRWNMEVLAGMRFGFLMNVSSKYRSPESMEYLQSIDHGAYQRFRMDATLDLGINYRLNENWSIGIHLPCSFGLNSRIANSKALNYRVGGLLNVRFHF
ncbi:MAG: PorT family protein [Crocinitomicaceae bacterium]|nr:PorT family protein [Crocinitomicaceae bacterium]